MNNTEISLDIESVFIKYSDLIKEFGKDKLINRYEELLSISNDFIMKMDYHENIYVNEMMLLHVICDYFSDILRLKRFHKLERVNEIKIISYEIYWLLKRKPLQLKVCSDELVYVNEQFALSRIIHFLGNNEIFLTTLENDKLNFFMDTLFYFLKYRLLDAQSLEMCLISFHAGRIFEEELKKHKKSPL